MQEVRQQLLYHLLDHFVLTMKSLTKQMPSNSTKVALRHKIRHVIVLSILMIAMNICYCTFSFNDCHEYELCNRYGLVQMFGYLNPAYSLEGKEFLTLLTAQLGSTTLTLLPSHPQHQPVSCRYAVNLYFLQYGRYVITLWMALY